jgi:hypothetical protein
MPGIAGTPANRPSGDTDFVMPQAICIGSLRVRAMVRAGMSFLGRKECR